LGFGKTEIFLQRGLDSQVADQLGDLPDRQSRQRGVSLVGMRREMLPNGFRPFTFGIERLAASLFYPVQALPPTRINSGKNVLPHLQA
jgi:hypothetical protein